MSKKNNIEDDKVGFSSSVEEKQSFEAWNLAQKIERLSDKDALDLFGTSSKREIFSLPIEEVKEKLKNFNFYGKK